jgi:prepilin-type N-terminal cleavage/methylation domain-containing protein
MKNQKLDFKGFTLIELLVVISIIGVLTTLVVTNLNEARARARDVAKKQRLSQLKSALQLYYNDFMRYPATGNGAVFNACGATGTTACTPGGAFSAGSGPTVYLNQLIQSGSYFEFKYYPCNTGDTYRVKVTLENASDPELTASQTRCPAATCSLSYSSTDYVVCP